MSYYALFLLVDNADSYFFIFKFYRILLIYEVRTIFVDGIPQGYAVILLYICQFVL